MGPLMDPEASGRCWCQLLAAVTVGRLRRDG
jgi:hypothetical protein